MSQRKAHHPHWETCRQAVPSNGGAVDWTFVSPSNSRVEVLSPTVMVLAGGAPGRWLGHEGGACMNGVSVLIRGGRRACLSALWRYSETGHQSVTQKRALTQTCPYWRWPLELWEINSCWLETTQSVLLCHSSLNWLRLGRYKVPTKVWALKHLPRPKNTNARSPGQDQWSENVPASFHSHTGRKETTVKKTGEEGQELSCRHEVFSLSWRRGEKP